MGGKMRQRIRFTASRAPAAVEALARLTARYGQAETRRADVIVALGGDGFMLQTLHSQPARDLPVYGMNCGTIGFLMNGASGWRSCPATGRWSRPLRDRRPTTIRHMGRSCPSARTCWR